MNDDKETEEGKEELPENLEEVVRSMISAHDLQSFTMRMLFAEVKNHFNLSDEHLAKIKGAIKQIAADLLNELSSKQFEKEDKNLPSAKTPDDKLDNERKGVPIAKRKIKGEIKERVPKKPRLSKIVETSETEGEQERKTESESSDESEDESVKRSKPVRPVKTLKAPIIKAAKKQSEIKPKQRPKTEPVEGKTDIDLVKQLVAKAKFGPRIYRDLNKEDPKEYLRELKKRALEIFRTEMVGENPGVSLPTLKEVIAWRKKKDWEIELAEMGVSADTLEDTLPRRRPKVPTVSKTEDKEDVLAGVRELAGGNSSSSKSNSKPTSSSTSESYKSSSPPPSSSSSPTSSSESVDNDED